MTVPECVRRLQYEKSRGDGRGGGKARLLYTNLTRILECAKRGDALFRALTPNEKNMLDCVCVCVCNQVGSTVIECAVYPCRHHGRHCDTHLCHCIPVLFVGVAEAMS